MMCGGGWYVNIDICIVTINIKLTCSPTSRQQRTEEDGTGLVMLCLSSPLKLLYIYEKLKATYIMNKLTMALLPIINISVIELHLYFVSLLPPFPIFGCPHTKNYNYNTFLYFCSYGLLFQDTRIVSVRNT